MGLLKKIAPKKFLCCYSLSTGAFFAALILLFVTLICILALIGQVMSLKSCTSCEGYAWRNAYSFSVSAVIDCIVMSAMHGLLFWGIKTKKTCILLSWVVLTSMWLSQVFFILLILLCVYMADVAFILWIITFIFGMLAMCILIYLDLVVLGLWFDLDDAKKTQNVAIESDTRQPH